MSGLSIGTVLLGAVCALVMAIMIEMWPRPCKTCGFQKPYHHPECPEARDGGGDRR